MLILLPLVLNNQTSLKLTFEVLMRHKVFLNHIAVRGCQHAYSAIGFNLLQRNIQKRLQAAVVIFAQTNLVNLPSNVSSLKHWPLRLHTTCIPCDS